MVIQYTESNGNHGWNCNKMEIKQTIQIFHLSKNLKLPQHNLNKSKKEYKILPESPRVPGPEKSFQQKLDLSTRSATFSTYPGGKKASLVD